MCIEEFNGWWFTGSVPADLLQEYRRGLFVRLAKNMDRRHITSIVGLRRTGKTTLIFQLIQKLLGEGVIIYKDIVRLFGINYRKGKTASLRMVPVWRFLTKR